MSVEFRKWPKIRRFGDAVRYATARRSGVCVNSAALPDEIAYVGTVKLHGTNAGVCVDGDRFVAQSRSRFISAESDNMGFAAWCDDEAVRAELESLAKRVSVDGQVTLYGEWCGPGIQRGVALSGLPSRHFVLFGARLSDRTLASAPQPGDSARAVGIHHVSDAGEWRIDVPLTDSDELVTVASRIGELVDAVEGRCPYAARFGVDGVGEGLVWVPEDLTLRQDTDLWFKSKGDKHQKTKKKRTPMAPILPEQFASIQAFVDANVDEARLLRAVDGLREDGHPIAIESTGHFLKWVGGDVKDECAAELDASGLEWKQVARHVNERAAAWFRSNI